MKITISVSSKELAKLAEFMKKHMRDVTSQISWLTPADILANKVLIASRKGKQDSDPTLAVCV